MRRAERAEPAGHWPRERLAGTVTLAYDDRHRRRLRLVSDGGEAFMLDLPQTRLLEEGDGLALSDGAWLEVKAASEALLEVKGRDAEHLARLAWHIGNRHLPAQIEAQRLLIRDDHVIAAMLRGLGAALRPVREPFRPEHGAYAGQERQDGHDHAH